METGNNMEELIRDKEGNTYLKSKSHAVHEVEQDGYININTIVEDKKTERNSLGINQVEVEKEVPISSAFRLKGSEATLNKLTMEVPRKNKNISITISDRKTSHFKNTKPEVNIKDIALEIDNSGVTPNRSAGTKNDGSKVNSNELVEEIPIEIDQVIHFKEPVLNKLENDIFDKVNIQGMTKKFKFAENVKERRYKENEIVHGRHFYKFRYISEKLVEMNNLDEFNRVPEDKKGLHFFADDKNVIKLNCLFLQKVEKGIFLFNLKKYEESCSYLKESSIIKSDEEFGEFLLLFPGLDKNIIGDFLAKEKPPNHGHVIAKHFIGKMNFGGQKILDSLRYLLAKVNLPKDSSLLLKIIEVFSDAYFADTCSGIEKKYKDTTAVYLMASIIMSLNTQFHRKGINNIKVMAKEDFIKMVKENVDRETADEVYEELKVHKLDFKSDCICS
jgi:Sec7-like guanine-nucleotide exchange factor